MVNDPDPPRDAQAESARTLVFVAVAVGGLGIGFGIAATVLMLKSQSNVTAPSATALLPQPSSGPAPRSGPWTDELHADVCPAPCCGGAACRVSAENAGKKTCKDGETHCQPCSSKLSCIPGGCGELFDGDEELTLHLSGVLERGNSGEAVDACKTGRDLWLCVKRADEGEWQCLSQREACSNKSRSPAGVAVRAVELTRRGLWFEVREGGPDGATLASKNEALYKSALQRRGLCGGFRGEFEPGPVSAFTFYLDLPPGPEAPSPRRVAAREAALDGGPADAAAAEPSAAAAVVSAPVPSPPASATGVTP